MKFSLLTVKPYELVCTLHNHLAERTIVLVLVPYRHSANKDRLLINLTSSQLKGYGPSTLPLPLKLKSRK